MKNKFFFKNCPTSRSRSPFTIPDPRSPISPKNKQGLQEQNKRDKRSCGSCKILSLLSKKPGAAPLCIMNCALNKFLCPKNSQDC